MSSVPRVSLVLAIEISNPSAWSPQVPVMPGVAIGVRRPDGPSLIAAAPIDPQRVHDDELMPVIDRLLAAHHFAAHDLSAIAVSVGPGGFTATRIAVTTAKLIAYATGATCIPVPSAAVAAHAVTDSPGNILVLLATKNQSVHATVFSPSGEQLGTSIVCEASELSLDGIHTIIADRFAPATLLERLEHRGIHALPPCFSPAALLAIHTRYPACSPHELEPIYPREPEAVTKWRELKRLGRK